MILKGLPFCLGSACESALRSHPMPASTTCRSANNLNGLNRTQLGNTIWRAPLVWLALNLLRFVLIGAFKPLFWLTLHLTWCAGLPAQSPLSATHHSTNLRFSVVLASHCSYPTAYI